MTDLEALIASSPSSPAYDEVAAGALGVATYSPGDGEKYIAPIFTAEVPLSNVGAAQIILVAAPAAVGKSALARQLSRSTNNPVWDLGAQTLGASSFVGALWRLYDERQGSMLAQLGRDGCLLLDGADEGLVRAGAKGFEEAIQDLGRIALRSAATRPIAVILGRPDTIDTCYLHLEELGVRSEIISVSFFDETAARSFVSRKAELGEHLQSQLDSFLDDFFTAVQRAMAVEGWQPAQQFLGYAPILDALARFAQSRENPHALFQDLRKQGDSAHTWSLLAQVIESVLVREQTEKVTRGLTAGSAEEELARVTYDPENQLRLLFSEDPTSTILALIEEAPEADRDSLRRRIEEQFTIHPFLRSSISASRDNPLRNFATVALRDYAIVRAIGLGDESLTDLIAYHWSDPEVSPTPILSRFAFDATQRFEMSNETLPMLFESHAAGFMQDTSLDLRFAEVGGDAHEVLEAVLREGEAIVGVLRSDWQGSPRVSFSRGLARTAIDLDGWTVELGSTQRDFALGPSVTISAAELVCDAVELRVIGNAQPTLRNHIEVESLSGRTTRIIDPGDGLVVSAPRLRHPWTGKKVSIPDGSTSELEQELFAAGMRFRKNFKWYARGTMVRALSYPADGMERILGKERADRAWHDFLLESGRLREEDGNLLLDLPAGVSNGDVFNNDLSNQNYRELVLAFVRR